MSAFVCSNDHINRIVNVFDYTDEYGSPMDYPDIGFLDLPAYIEDRRLELTEFGKKLIAMNKEAVKQRYGADDGDSLPGEEEDTFEYRPLSNLPSRIEMYKLLRCYLYQCYEGDVPDRGLFQEIDEWNDRLAHMIVSDMDEYIQCPWEV